MNIKELVTKIRFALASYRSKVSSFFGSIMSTITGSFIGAPLAKVKAFLTNISQFLKRLVTDFLRFSLSDRLRTLILGILAVLVGAVLVIAPAKQLAMGKTFGLQTLIMLVWLLTGVGTMATGTGILLRLRLYRWSLKLAFACSLPLAGAFLYRTAILIFKMRQASGAARDVFKPWISGGILLSAITIGVSVFLFYLLRAKSLKQLQCSVGVLTGRLGPLFSGFGGAVIGCGVGLLVWFLLRGLGLYMNFQWSIDAVILFPVEYFIAGGALICGILGTLVGYSRKSRPGFRAQGGPPSGGSATGGSQTGLFPPTYSP